ncbi:MAG: site-specific integrase [Planctomycetota bacterium]
MLYKRKKLQNGKPDPNAPYWVRFRHRGEEVRRSTGTNNRKLAKEFEEALRRQAFEEKSLGRKIYLWQEAADGWELAAQRSGKKSLSNDKLTRRWFDNVLSDVRLDAITNEDISKIRDTLLAERIKRGTDFERTRSPATVNRYLAYLRSVLNHARKAHMLDQLPTIEMLPEPKFEGRNLSDDEAAAILSALDKTGRVPHVRAMAELALETGLRFSNLARLTWDTIRLETPPDKSHLFVPATQSKSGRPVGIPLSTRAADIIRQQQGKHPEFVFAYKGRAPVTTIKTAWLRAVRDAGLDGVRFHDLRHSWASRQVAKGIPLAVIAELGGWRSTEMLERRYSHLRRDDLAAYVD